MTTNSSEIGKTTEFCKKISFDAESHLYIKTKIWGATGDHYHVLLKGEDEGDSVNSEDVIFNEMELYYKQSGRDSLLVYFPTNSFKDIKNYKIGSINIILKGFMSSNIESYKNNYKDMGLLRISIYDGIE